MDDYFFESHVRSCKVVEENTSFLEIFNFSNGESHYDKGKLPMSEFDNFLNQTGVFELPTKPNAKIISGMRLILQLKASNPDTFTSQYISFTHDEYIDMCRKLRLPFRIIESSSVVGPFFWSAIDLDDVHPHQHIIFRKSDVRKKGLTRGWELTLSHDFRTAITTGYAKGTESSNLDKTIDQHLRACANLTAHPMLLPTIIVGHELDKTMDERMRNTRQELRRLENIITFRNEVDPKERFKELDLDVINQALVECHGQVLWKRPQAYLATLDQMEKAMGLFGEVREKLLREGQLSDHHADPAIEDALDKLNRSILSRYSFHKQKLKGVQHYASTTISRLEVQLGALYNIIAQKESKLNLETANHQRLLALAAKRDSQSMKALSIVGAIFLPGTYLASLFSMTFFNFQNSGSSSDSDSSSSSNNSNDGPVVASSLWIYFAFTVPLTLLVVAIWLWWDKRREKRFADEERRLEEALPHFENIFVAALVEKRTGLNSLNLNNAASMDTKRWETM